MVVSGMYVRLSNAVKRRFEALQEPRIDIEDIREVVDGHLRQAREVAEAGGPVDIALAEDLHRTCMALLASEKLNETDYRLVQAGCLYFADDEDDDGDFTSRTGLADDVDVINYVCASVGRPDLAVR